MIGSLRPELLAPVRIEHAFRVSPSVFPVATDPEFVPAADVDFMRDDDWIIGLCQGEASRCYPAFMLDNYHVVNDTVEGIPLAVTHCEICNSNAVFRAELEGRRLIFGTGGLYGATLAVRDEETGGLWSHGMGLALEGSLAGTQLTRLQSFQASYGEWLELHPETEVMVWPAPDSHPDPRHGHGTDATFALPGMEELVLRTMPVPEDLRLPEDELIVTIFAGGAAAALRLQDLYRADCFAAATVGGVDTVTLGAGEGSPLTGTFTPSLLGKPEARLELGLDGGQPVDRRSGSTLRVDGQFVSGPLRGERLQPVPTMLNKWHSLTCFLPEVPIVDVGVHPAPARSLPSALERALEGIAAVVPAHFVRRHYELELLPGAVAGVRVELDGGVLTDLVLFDDPGAAEELAASADPSLEAGPVVALPAPQADDAAAESCRAIFERVELGSGLDRGEARDSLPPSLKTLLAGLSESGFRARIELACARERLPVGCLSGAEIEVDGARFLAYRFASSTEAERYNPDPAHSLIAGPFVLRSDPPDVYRASDRMTLRRDDSEISWSPWLGEERFAAALAGAVEAMDMEMPA